MLAIGSAAGRRSHPERYGIGGVGRDGSDSAKHQGRKGDEAAAARDRVQRAAESTGKKQEIAVCRPKYKMYHGRGCELESLRILSLLFHGARPLSSHRAVVEVLRDGVVPIADFHLSDLAVLAKAGPSSERSRRQNMWAG